jgi:hypothetical protein
MVRDQQWQPGPRMPTRRVTQGAFAFLGQQQASAERFPVESIDQDCLAGAVSRWTARGHAISFGLSGDGGAFGVHLIADGDKRSKWFGTVQECEDFLTTVPGPAAPVQG